MTTLKRNQKVQITLTTTPRNSAVFHSPNDVQFSTAPVSGLEVAPTHDCDRREVRDSIFGPLRCNQKQSGKGHGTEGINQQEGQANEVHQK